MFKVMCHILMTCISPCVQLPPSFCCAGLSNFGFKPPPSTLPAMAGPCPPRPRAARRVARLLPVLVLGFASHWVETEWGVVSLPDTSGHVSEVRACVCVRCCCFRMLINSHCCCLRGFVCSHQDSDVAFEAFGWRVISPALGGDTLNPKP